MTILGAGSIDLAPSVIAVLANYFGERPFEICLWDADDERLDLMCRFARTCCAVTKSLHVITATSDLDEALERIDLAINIVDDNCALKHCVATGQETPSLEAIDETRKHLAALPEIDESRVISIQTHSPKVFRNEAIYQSNAKEPFELALQVLRWSKGEEYPFEFLKAHDNTPFKGWLDRVTSEMIAKD
jgi:hypothetical protein